MERVDLVIQHFTQGEITPAQEKALLNAVRNGTGLAGWHGGTGDSFRSNVEFQYMVGGQWVAHPGNIITYDVNIIDQQDPVTAGLNNFSMQIGSSTLCSGSQREGAGTTTSAGAQQLDRGCRDAVVWKKYTARERVFYSCAGPRGKRFRGG